MKITEITKLSSEIQNFYDCYEDTTDKLYSKRPSDLGKISPEDLLEFLLENPHMMEIAQRIKDLK